MAAIERRRSISSSSVSADILIRTRSEGAADEDDNDDRIVGAKALMLALANNGAPPFKELDSGCWRTNAFVVAMSPVDVTTLNFILFLPG